MLASRVFCLMSERCWAEHFPLYLLRVSPCTERHIQKCATSERKQCNIRVLRCGYTIQEKTFSCCRAYCLGQLYTEINGKMKCLPFRALVSPQYCHVYRLRSSHARAHTQISKCNGLLLVAHCSIRNLFAAWNKKCSEVSCFFGVTSTLHGVSDIPCTLLEVLRVCVVPLSSAKIMYISKVPLC